MPPPTKIDPAPPSAEVERLLGLIPTRAGFRFTGLPTRPDLHPDRLFVWSPDEPDIVRDKRDGEAWPNEQYPEDRTITVTNDFGEPVSYPYHQDANGKRYFHSAHVWFWQRDHVMGSLPSLAATDPLGTARLIHRFAENYVRSVPTLEYPWYNRPVEPSSTPPEYWWGGYWARWSTSDLGVIRKMADAIVIINRTNAFQVLSDELGTDVWDQVVNTMIKPSVEWFRSFPVIYSNNDAQNLRGLAAFAPAIGEPDYIHQAVEWCSDFVGQTFLFDGFFRETTVSYHVMAMIGIDQVLERVQGWTDPDGYVSPRSGRRFDDLDLTKDMPMLDTALQLPNRLIHPDGHYVPLDDTWPADTADDPDLSEGTMLLPAAGVARLSRDPDESDLSGPSQVHLTFTPKHLHFDRGALNLMFWGAGQELIPDIGYTHTRWAYRTRCALGANTVVVDAADMEVEGEAANGGDLDLFVDVDDDLSVVRASDRHAYPQTSTYTREAWSIGFPADAGGGSYLLDLFRIAGGGRHEYTLQGDANHDATFSTSSELTPYGPYLLPEGVQVVEPERETQTGSAGEHYYGYIYLNDVERAELADGRYEVSLATTLDDGSAGAGARILGVVEPGATELFLGVSKSLRATRVYGQSHDTNDEADKYTHPKLVVRREGTDLVSNFVTTVEPIPASAGGHRIETVERLEVNGGGDGVIAVRVIWDGHTDIVISAPDTSTVSAGGVSMTGRLAVVRLAGDAVTDMVLVGGTELRYEDVRLTGAGPVSGEIDEVFRRRATDDIDGFATSVAVPEAAVGRTMVVTHPDDTTHGYRIKAVSARGGGSVVELDRIDPGFSIADDGTSRMQFEPFTEWTGTHRFRIDNVDRRSA